MTDRGSKTLLLISTCSVHTDRFMNGLAPYFDVIHLVTNLAPRQPAPNLGEILIVDFSRMAIFSTPRKIRAFARGLNPSVVSIHQAGTSALHGFWGLLGLAIPTLLTAWGSDVLITPKRGLLWRFMVQYNLRRANQITCDAEVVANTIRKLGGRANLSPEVLNFGVDGIPSQPITKKEKRIVSCRLHKPLYRVDVILQAFAELVLSGNLEGWTLTLAAEGTETRQLRHMAESLGVSQWVEFPGFLSMDELLALCRKSALFVSVPKSDALSISLLEAMAYGCIPILSDLPSNREVVIDGLNGFIVHEMKALPAAIQAAVAVSENPQIMNAVATLNHRLINCKGDTKKNMHRFASILLSLANS